MTRFLFLLFFWSLLQNINFVIFFPNNDKQDRETHLGAPNTIFIEILLNITEKKKHQIRIKCNKNVAIPLLDSME